MNVEQMIHDYCKAFSLDPESDLILNRDIRCFYQFWAFEGNNIAIQNYFIDNPQ